MLRTLFSKLRPEDGQALVLFAAGLVAFLGLVGMSIDVGRFVWARTSIQAGVDASALAAAQSMPDTSAATTKANEYWIKDSGFIQAQGTNVLYDVTFPPGNKALHVHAEADLSTWFLRIFGFDHWHVWADGDAASQVLDISLVLDISQSMCDDSYPRVDQRPNMSPGQGTVPQLSASINSTQTVISVKDTTPFTDPVSNYITGTSGWGAKLTGGSYPATNTYQPSGSTTGPATPYWLAVPKYSYGGQTFTGRAGLIMLGTPAGPGTQAVGEVMQIVGVNAAAKTITVIRGVNDKRGSQTNPTYAGVPTTKTSHPANQEIWMNRNGGGCTGAAPSSSGPYQPFDQTVVDAQYFTTLFNPTYDEFGFVYFSSTGHVSQTLTSNFSSVRTKIGSSGPPSGGTNTAHGLTLGRSSVLDGPNKRANAVRVEVLITDGRAKEYCGTTYVRSNYENTSCPGSGGGIEGNSIANGAAEAEAQYQANTANVILFVIGLGAGADSNWLKRLADGGVAGVGPCQNNQPGCRYYDAPTTDELQAAFTDIASRSHIALIK